MLTKLEEMLKEAERQFQNYAASHGSSNCAHYGGRVSALKEVIKMLKE